MSEFSQTACPPNIYSLEGPDGVGKTTVAKRVVEVLNEAGQPAVYCRTPGTTPFGEAARLMLLDPTIQMSPVELSLFFTATHVSMLRAAREHAEAGKVVIFDRCYWSNYAYRTAEGMPIHMAMGFNAYMPYLIPPAQAFHLQAPEEVRMDRVRASGKGGDRFERRGPDFFRAVADAYQTLTNSGFLTAVDASRPFEDVVKAIVLYIADGVMRAKHAAEAELQRRTEADAEIIKPVAGLSQVGG